MFLPLAMFANTNLTKQNREQEKGTATQVKWSSRNTAHFVATSKKLTNQRQKSSPLAVKSESSFRSQAFLMPPAACFETVWLVQRLSDYEIIYLILLCDSKVLYFVINEVGLVSSHWLIQNIKVKLAIKRKKNICFLRC